MKNFMRIGYALALCVCAAALGMAVGGAAPAQSAAAPAKSEARSFKFSFWAEPVPGYTHVDASARYTPENGVGFENIGGAFPTLVGSDTNNPLHSGSLTAKEPFFYSVNVPEGNYKVTVTLGGSAAAVTTVKAELRRLMLDQVKTAAGESVKRTFAVNVHKPPILDKDGKQVGLLRISGRELGRGGGGIGPGPGGGAPLNRTQGGEGWSWDDALTLEFSGTPAVSAIDIERDDTIHNVFICGDSTVCDQPAEPFTSWGQVITRWIKPDYAVSNYAISGNTAAAFYAANRMGKIVSLLQPGDYVFVQYGHNDMKSTAAGALETYKNNYRKFVADTKAKGATPVLMTPVSRETFDANGKITNSFITNSGDDYVKAARDVAAELKVDFIDLNAISAKLYEAVGPGKSQVMFANATEKTHHSDFGSYEIAKCVVQAIIDNKLPLAKSIVDDWKTFDPAKPDAFEAFTLPKDPMPGGRGGATPAGN